MALKPSSALLVTLCLTSSAILFFFGTGLSPVWLLTWLAPLPVLWLSTRVPPAMAFLIAALAYLLGGLNEWSYLAAIVPFWILILNSVAPACIFGLTVWIFRLFAISGKLWQAALIAPAFWVSYEYIMSLVSPHGTIGNIAYSQLNFLPVLQIASVTGIWGISFSLLLFAATLAVLFSPGPLRQKAWLAIGSGGFLICVFLYGAWRLASTPKDSSTIKVGLIASDDFMNLIVPTTDDAHDEFVRFGQQMQKLSSQGIQVFVLPEHSGPVTDATVAATDTTLGEIAKQTHAFIAIGVDRISQKAAWNQERLYAPDGRLLATYSKHHLLPGLESRFTPATSRTALNVPYGAMCAGPGAKSSSGVFGLEICKDMDFQKLSRQYASDGVALMLVPAWDFTVDAWAHGHLAIMRAVEDGFSLARAAKQGTVYAADDRGRVIAEKETKFTPYAIVVATLPVRHDATVYAMLGDWFAWLNMAIFVALGSLLLIKRH